MKKLPMARSRDIVVQEFNKEILIYDLKIHEAYCLNETSSTVYRACDGQTTPEELKSGHGLTDEIISLAVDDLRRKNLVENNGGDLPTLLSRLSRREALRKIGLTSMIALPVISSLVAPTAAQTQSKGSTTCAAPGQTVTIVGATSNAQCTSMLQNSCCSKSLSVSAIACRTVGGVTTCPTCTGTCL
jgi:hypothetical protein